MGQSQQVFCKKMHIDVPSNARASLGCFDEVREECGWFQDTKGFCVNWSREVGIVAKGRNLHHNR